MMHARWLDHAAPWLAWVSILSTGIFELHELGAMAAPLLLALGVEYKRLDLGRFERWINLSALLYALALWVMRIQVIPAVAFLLFLLCAIRLALPRRLPQRRQVLLMGFLIFLLSGLATFELKFSLLVLAWLLLVSATLLQHAWEASAQYRGGAMLRPPFVRIPAYAFGTVLLGAGLFSVLPRLTVGLRPQFLPQLGWASQAGFTDRLDLGGGVGPVAPNYEVVARLVPRGALAEDPDLAAHELSLLRTLVLEQFDGSVWSTAEGLLPRDPTRSWQGPNRHRADLYLAPSPMGVIPLPYGLVEVETPQGQSWLLQNGSGESLRLRFPSRQVLTLPMTVVPGRSEAPLLVRTREQILGRRLALLTYPGEDTAFVRDWSLRVVPEDLGADALAQRLAARLRTFTYTTENPASRDANPLRAFLEVHQAGHCEYFASALALMLRHRGVPARVANGYRLGPWIAEGGYHLVTQNEFHAWVEYYDTEQRAWRVVDPTPSAPATALQGDGLRAFFQRWTDALQFRWERHVVRFSDADQVAMLEWMRNKAENLRAPSLPVPRSRALQALLLVLGGLLLVWRWHREGWPKPWNRPRGHLPQLDPLVRALRNKVPVHPGETVKDWLERLGALRPDRREALQHLVRHCEALAYGGVETPNLKRLVTEERRAWRKAPQQAPKGP